MEKSNLIFNSILFYEDGFSVKTLEGVKEKYDAFKLRKKIFCDELHWVECQNRKIEIDSYDAHAILIGALDWSEELIGVLRIIPAQRPMMIEKEFISLIAAPNQIRKTRNTIEISRMGVSKSIGSRRRIQVSNALCEAVFHWCTIHYVRFVYMVIEQKMLRNINLMGARCKRIGPVRIFPDGNKPFATIVDLSSMDSPKRWSLHVKFPQQPEQNRMATTAL
jgi:N-acyl-L-homoserine lactone synthetase